MTGKAPSAPGRERRIVDSMGFEIELRATPKIGSPGVIVGHAAVFGAISEHGPFRERVARGAFANTIRTDDIRALFNHDPNIVLGRRRAGTLSLREDERGLGVTIDLPNTSMGRAVAEAIRRGDVSQMSFGFDALDEAWENDAAGRVRVLKRVRLFDVSPVTFPAYPQTEIALRWATAGANLQCLRAALEELEG